MVLFLPIGLSCWISPENGSHWMDIPKHLLFQGFFFKYSTGSTIRTSLHGRINPKDWQVLFLGDAGFLLFFRVVSGDYGKPCSMAVSLAQLAQQNTRPRRLLVPLVPPTSDSPAFRQFPPVMGTWRMLSSMGTHVFSSCLGLSLNPYFSGLKNVHLII